MMDEIFGKKNFRNEIVWHYQAGTKGRKRFGRKHDVILFYSFGKGAFNRISKPVVNSKRYNKVDDDGRFYDVNGQGKRYYLDEGQSCDDVWTWVQEKQFQQINSRAKERVGYPTQKPLSLLERIIKASSNEGDMVFDPFCGCATTCVAAEKLDRQWVGIDISEKAAELVKERINNELGLLLFNPIHRTDIPGDRGGKRSRDIKNVLYGKQEGMCGGCGHWYRIKDFEVDHITPKSKGGPDTDENLQLLCGNCNRIKGDKSQEYLISKVRSMAG